MDRTQYKRIAAFSLVEAMIVVALLLIMAAIIFPAFRAAKAQAHATVCLSQFHQVTMAGSIYTTDYDDQFMVARYRADESATSETDRTWVQNVLPYSRNFDLFHCPSDYSRDRDYSSRYNEDVIPGGTTERFYEDSKRVNTGYNYLYLSPLMRDPGDRMNSRSRSVSEIGYPADTILFGDSAHHITENGAPRGGGSYLILPPCRFASTGGDSLVDTFAMPGVGSDKIFQGGLYWSAPLATDPPSNSGGLYPWHENHLTVAFADSHVKRITLEAATSGCHVEEGWQGHIFDREQYLWDRQ